MEFGVQEPSTVFYFKPLRYFGLEHNNKQTDFVIDGTLAQLQS